MRAALLLGGIGIVSAGQGLVCPDYDAATAAKDACPPCAMSCGLPTDGEVTRGCLDRVRMPTYTVTTGHFKKGSLPSTARFDPGLESNLLGDVTFFPNSNSNGGGVGIKVRLMKTTIQDELTNLKWHIHQNGCDDGTNPHYTGDGPKETAAYKCDNQNTTAMNATCFVGDLAGKFGRINITRNGNDTEATFVDHTGMFTAESLVDKSIVIHTPSQKVCATIRKGSGEFFKPKHYP